MSDGTSPDRDVYYICDIVFKPKLPPGGWHALSESMTSVQDVAGVVRSQRHRFKEPNWTSSTSSESALVNVRHALTPVDPRAGLSKERREQVDDTLFTLSVVIQHPHSRRSFHFRRYACTSMRLAQLARSRRLVATASASPHVGLPGGIPRTSGALHSFALSRYIGCAGGSTHGFTVEPLALAFCRNMRQPGVFKFSLN
jgi:hypothetical protein